MSFQLLQDDKSWDAFKTGFSESHGMVREAVSWGDGPPVFPCLVTALPATSKKRVVCCFVTPDDARMLLGIELTDGEIGEPAIEADAAAPAPSGLSELVSLKKKVALLTDMVESYTRANSAHLRTFLKRAFFTGFYDTHETYEQSYAESLAYVDQLAEDHKRNLAIEHLHTEE
jgi:hypothetical protein